MARYRQSCSAVQARTSHLMVNLLQTGKKRYKIIEEIYNFLGFGHRKKKSIPNCRKCVKVTLKFLLNYYD